MSRMTSYFGVDTKILQISGQVEGRNIPCDVCGKLFATQDRMKAHMRSAHQTDKNCSCSICGSGELGRIHHSGSGEKFNIRDGAACEPSVTLNF